MAKLISIWEPSPVRCVDPDLVDLFRAKAGTKFCHVTYVKKDGAISEKTLQFHAACRIVGNEKGDAQSERMAATGMIWGALRDGKSTSFRRDRVVSINAGGMSLKAN